MGGGIVLVQFLLSSALPKLDLVAEHGPPRCEAWAYGGPEGHCHAALS